MTSQLEQYRKCMKQYTEEYSEDCPNITIEEFTAADLIRECRFCGELLDERKCMEPICHRFVCPECANGEKKFIQLNKNQDGHIDYSDLYDKCIQPEQVVTRREARRILKRVDRTEMLIQVVCESMQNAFRSYS